MEDPAAFAELPPRRVAQYGPAIVKDVVARMAPTSHPDPEPPCAAAFGIHFGNSIAGRRSAAALINRMYRWRGYGDKHFLEPHAGHLTLNASSAQALLATVTLRIDSAGRKSPASAAPARATSTRGARSILTSSAPPRKPTSPPC